MTQPATYTIQERKVTLPVVVRDASSGSATYLVSAEAARKLLPGPEIDVVELLPGRALLSIAVIDYKDNDLGDYNEISIALFVRERAAPRGIPYLGTLIDFMRGKVATYIHHLPVNQSFTRDAGETIWGFPKTVQEIDFEYASDRVRCRLIYDGRHPMTISMPRGGERTLPDAELRTYTHIQGVPHRTSFTSGAQGVGFGLGGAEIELGEGTIADELRSLGLPKKAMMTSWMERMHGRFEAPEKF